MHEGTFPPNPCQQLLFVVFLIIAILTSVRWYPIVVLVCSSLVTSATSNIFRVPVGHLCVFLEKCLFRSFAYFSVRFPFLDVDLLSLFILDINLLLDIPFANLLPFSRWLFHFVYNFFFWARTFLFDIVPSVYFCFPCLQTHIQKIIAKTDV